jgi:hypothetical protein
VIKRKRRRIEANYTSVRIVGKHLESILEISLSKRSSRDSSQPIESVYPHSMSPHSSFGIVITNSIPSTKTDIRINLKNVIPIKFYDAHINSSKLALEFCLYSHIQDRINHIEVRCDNNVFELATNITIKHNASESANG